MFFGRSSRRHPSSDFKTALVIVRSEWFISRTTDWRADRPIYSNTLLVHFLFRYAIKPKEPAQFCVVLKKCVRLDIYSRQIYIRQIVFKKLNAALSKASSLILTVKFQSRKQDNSPQRQLAPRQLVPHSEDNSTHIAEDNSPNVVFMHNLLKTVPHVYASQYGEKPN